jgi:hypothetical protein
MMVQVLNLGTNWWTRVGHDIPDPADVARNTAFYNSTGVRCGRKIRRHWIIPGLVRFNGVGDVRPDLPHRAIGRTFVCTDLTYSCDGNRLLFKSKAHRFAHADVYLLVVSEAVYGRINFVSPVWKSALSRVIAASQLRGQQEAMLLMRVGDWIETAEGFWHLSQPANSRELPCLVRIGDAIRF